MYEVGVHVRFKYTVQQSVVSPLGASRKSFPVLQPLFMPCPAPVRWFYCLVFCVWWAGNPGTVVGDDDHWSLRPLSRPTIPTGDAWGRTPVDAFVQQQRMRAGLLPAPAAASHTLIRRVHLDLLGIPPTPQEVADFLADSHPLAYERMVERALASPRYGERWAQHWLDLVRFAESSGYEMNFWFPNAWPYRDYVIESLNSDKPYDQFIFEQLAGDQIEEDPATGFLVAGPYDRAVNQDPKFKAQQRQDELDEIVKATGAVFLGFSIGCARCHDHKFDPITQQDYYNLQAVFAGVHYRERKWRGPENDRWQQQLPALSARIIQLQKQLEAFRLQHSLRSPVSPESTEERFEPRMATSVRLRIDSTLDGRAAQLDELEVWSTGPEPANVALEEAGASAQSSGHAVGGGAKLPDGVVDGRLQGDIFWRASRDGSAWIQVDLAQPFSIDRVVWKARDRKGVPADYQLQVRNATPLPVTDEVDEMWTTIATSDDRLPAYRDQRTAKEFKLKQVSAAEVQQLAAALAELAPLEKEYDKLAKGPQVFSGDFATAKKLYRLHRGDPTQPREVATPDVPAIMGTLSLAVTADEASRRTALGRWLGSKAHPLPARVMANRIWQHHFGMGLVTTPSDFGVMGSAPSHPELLEWLAAELMDHEWSLKHLHRILLLSRTYQQESSPRAKEQQRDPNNRLLWRFSPRRLAGEVLRDSILHCSGQLDLSMNGPGFAFFQRASFFSGAIPESQLTTNTWRRMIYGTKIRQETVNVFGEFDCPDAGQMTPRRTRSNTPLQALNLFNSEFVNHQARLFANEVQRVAGPDPQAQVRQAVLVCLGRLPDAEEQARLRDLLQATGLNQVCRVLLNTNEFVFLN